MRFHCQNSFIFRYSWAIRHFREKIWVVLIGFIFNFKNKKLINRSSWSNWSKGLRRKVFLAKLGSGDQRIESQEHLIKFIIKFSALLCYKVWKYTLHPTPFDQDRFNMQWIRNSKIWEEFCNKIYIWQRLLRTKEMVFLHGAEI